MVIKKGTVGVVNYRVYKLPGPTVDGWKVREDPLPQDLPVVDDRKAFRFRFGMDDIRPEIERLFEKSDKVIVQNKDLVYEVELCGDAIRPMTPDEIFNELVQLKQLGNDLMKSGQIQDACERYSEAIELMMCPDFNRRTEKDLKEVYIPLYLNKALCCLKTNQIGEALECCNRVIEVDPKNVKALFRRALAKIENKQIGSAKRDLLAASSVDPSNKEVEQKIKDVIEMENCAIDMAEKSLYEKMVNTHRTKVSIEFKIGDGDSKSMLIELLDDVVPRTVDNFKKLMEKYPGCSVLRIAKDQFFQTGDYEYNDASGGNAAIVDCQIRNRSFMNDERLDGKHRQRGVVGMCNYGPNTVTSQFYITLGACPHLNGHHVVFGNVVQGYEILDDINNVAPDDPSIDHRPKVPIVISSIEIVE